MSECDDGGSTAELKAAAQGHTESAVVHYRGADSDITTKQGTQ